MATRPATLLPLLNTPTDRGPTTDRDLLRRFAIHQDEAAFALLVKRHAPMVLGVCRRVLGNPADADDACQATFVVLARKAGSGRWRPSVASWLYATARQVALNARTARSRRARHEGRARAKPATNPLAEISGEELLDILDEELGKLPERYRAPVVLCCVEGLTRDEAAAQLGVPPATLKGQLERGRKRLHDALARRGVALGAGLLALLATAPAQATPPRLAQAVRAAVAGKAPPTVAALAETAAANGLVKKALTGLVLAAATAVIGFGLGHPRPTTAGPAADKDLPAKSADKKSAPPAADPKAPPAHGPTATGRVLAPDGKPLPGAALLLIGKGDRPVDLGTSGPDGRFAVRLPADWKGGYLVARAEGVGIDFAQFGDTDPKGDIELRTVADHPVRGRLVDTEGKPVAGAAVRVERLGTSAGNSLDPILEGWKKLTPFSASPAGEKQIWSGTGALWPAVTDKDGRFEFRGLGVERLAVLRLSGGGVTDGEAYVANRTGLDPKGFNDAVVKNGGGKPRWRLYGPDFTVVAEREKLIRGRVTDADTGEPRAGVHVLLTRTDGGDLLQVAPAATTDKDGRYEIRGARKAKSYMAEVAADTVNGYMPAQATAGDTPAYDPLTIDLRVRKGVVVTGRIIDKGTGKPVPGWALIGVPQGNPSVKEYPEFNSSAWFPMQQTDAEGRFRVVAIPGPVLLFGQPDNANFNRYKPPVADPKYPQFFKHLGDHTAYYMPGGAMTPLQGRSCKVLEIKPDAKVVNQDIELEPVDPPKKPLGRKAGPPPAKMEKKPAAGEKPESVAVSGRVVGPDNKPVADAAVAVWTRGAKSSSGRGTTDRDGRFRLSVPRADTESKPLLVASADGFGVDWQELTPGKDVTLRLAADDMPVQGRLLNLEGRGIAGVSVRVRRVEKRADGGDLTAVVATKQKWARGEYVNGPDLTALPADALTGPATATTDADGRFRLTGLGRERVVSLTVEGKTIEPINVEVFTRTGPVEGLFSGNENDAVYGAAFERIIPPGKPVIGTVREKGTNKPLAGIRVTCGRCSAKTDGDGRYRIDGPRKRDQYAVTASGVPYFDANKADVPDTPGFEPVTVDFELERGIEVRGRVRDAAGKPVAGTVAYLAFADNPHARALAGREPGGTVREDGSFSFTALPGPGVLAVIADEDNFRKVRPESDWKLVPSINWVPGVAHAFVRIARAEKDVPPAVEIRLEPAAAVRAEVVGPDGKPARGYYAAGLSASPRDNVSWMSQKDAPAVTICGLEKDRPRTVVVLTADGKLGKAQQVRADEAGPVRLRLDPLSGLSGRVVGADGRPRAGLQVRAVLDRKGGDGTRLPVQFFLTGGTWAAKLEPSARTDAAGKFHLDGLMPGLPYILVVSDDDTEVFRREGVSPPAAGKTAGLGDLRVR